jgi:hypothetical protein
MKWFFDVIRTLSPDCREAVRLQSESLDRPLPLLRRIGLYIHLGLCVWCRRYGKQIRFLRVAAQQGEKDTFDVPIKVLTPEARERIKRAVESAKEQHHE